MKIFKKNGTELIGRIDNITNSYITINRLDGISSNISEEIFAGWEPLDDGKIDLLNIQTIVRSFQNYIDKVQYNLEIAPMKRDMDYIDHSIKTEWDRLHNRFDQIFRKLELSMKFHQVQGPYIH